MSLATPVSSAPIPDQCHQRESAVRFFLPDRGDDGDPTMAQIDLCYFTFYLLSMLFILRHLKLLSHDADSISFLYELTCNHGEALGKVCSTALLQPLQESH
jgi:hypothetical protein